MDANVGNKKWHDGWKCDFVVTGSKGSTCGMEEREKAAKKRAVLSYDLQSAW
jgi:hypothetical protein